MSDFGAHVDGVRAALASMDRTFHMARARCDLRATINALRGGGFSASGVVKTDSGGGREGDCGLPASLLRWGSFAG